MSALNFIPPSRAGASAIKMDRWQKEEGGEGGRRKEEVEEEEEEEKEEDGGVWKL